MTPQEFIGKWKRANLAERSADQQHFLDLCEMLNQPKPASADPAVLQAGVLFGFHMRQRTINSCMTRERVASVWEKRSVLVP